MPMQGHPAVRPELDLVEQEDQLTHEISLDEKIDPEITLGQVFFFFFEYCLFYSALWWMNLPLWIIKCLFCFQFIDIFKPDPQYLESEKRYEELKKTILGEESEDEAGSDAGSDDEDEEEEDDDDEEDEQQMEIKDETETNLVNLRRTIYLTIMSSIDFEEAGHKLLKIKLEPGQEVCGVYLK